MKKELVKIHLSENDKAITLFCAACGELDRMRWSERDYKPLRCCSAETVETENFILLRSYQTYIAAIDKRTNTLADVLRTEYGFTSTSAQHIRKFERDFCAGGRASVFLRSVSLSIKDLSKIFYLYDHDTGALETYKSAEKIANASKHWADSIGERFTISDYEIMDGTTGAA